MNENQNNTTNRSAMVNALAVVGLVVLIGASIWLAVYSARFVPAVVGNIGSAAVYLGSVFTPADEPTLSVVPTPVASTTIPFGNATSSVPTGSTPIPTTSAQPNWTPGTPIAFASSTNSSPAPVNYYGLPDLSVQIETIGYTLADGSIVSTTSIPAYKQGVVKFRVTNIGTNVSGPWLASISVAGNAEAQMVESLVPTEPRGFIAYFFNNQPGVNRTVIVSIDPDHKLTESSTANNTATASITILGS